MSPKIVQAHRNRAVALVKDRVEIEAHAGDGSQINGGLCALRQRREAFFCRRELSGQILALGSVELEVECDSIAPSPIVVGQQSAASGKILQGGGIGA